MDGVPQSVDGLDESVVLLVGYHPCCMPPCASVHHVEDHILVDEEEVTLHLLIELVRNVNRTSVTWPGLRPLTTDSTCLNNFWNQAQNLV